ncbi:NrfD/PsrC family molybdoenzyme membrane anchor subunit [Azospirillum halopraeferens]|uniref:NrfD/PsrC family molybdoenzyme membrane anchor subunit n=1 Tax=Azospirillum halopraeferens TaxID=34010 RepID=UPI0004141521|nr:NrfD/PsrC family molybdoenzyme membrane anchor subunit [Azospirillum halopraeferens]
MARTKTAFATLDSRSSRFVRIAGLLAAVAAAGGAAALYMEHEGHVVTGMNNQIVWGLPHVFAIFLIVAASGALNVASIASVFGRTVYKPLAPLSGLLAAALLAGGLAVLVLDLGRPDRLTVAMTHFNFRSIFAWNVLLYSGFFAIVGVYLWTMLDRRMNRWTSAAGTGAFVWRLVLTTGTGSIFGFLVARETYHSAVMAPLFIAMSLSFGTAAFTLVVSALYRIEGRPLGDAVLGRLARLQAIFVAAVLYFVVIQHLTVAYTARGGALEAYLLGGPYAPMFWFVQILAGTVAPLVLLLRPEFNRDRRNRLLAAGLVLLGGLAQVYVIVIGGQAWPLELFPGREVTSAAFDGTLGSYDPTPAEFLLGIGGVAVSLLIVAVACAALRFLPESLADAAVDPHHARADA